MIVETSLIRSFAANVDWIYAGLIRLAESDPSSDPDRALSGRLLYADELEGAGRVLVVAGKIAGASSLTATADPVTQRQAARDGVINFLAPSVDDALWILKREMRECNTVAVCVTQPPHVVEHEMAALGVLPDLLPPGALNACRFEKFLTHGARKIDPISVRNHQTVVTWSVDREPARWLPKLDVIALDCLGSFHSLRGCSDFDTWSARRWLQNAPRYLGRMAHGMRLLRCPTQVARSFLSRVREMTNTGILNVAVEMNLSCRGELECHRLAQPVESLRAVQHI
jgi:hypothetical protein